MGRTGGGLIQEGVGCGQAEIAVEKVGSRRAQRRPMVVSLDAFEVGGLIAPLQRHDKVAPQLVVHSDGGLGVEVADRVGIHRIHNAPVELEGDVGEVG